MRSRLNWNAFGLAVALSFAAIWAGFLMISIRPSTGLPVVLVDSRAASDVTDIWGTVLVVQVDSQAEYRLNGRHLAPAELRRELRATLCRRAERVVLFESSPDVSYATAVAAIEDIHSACPTFVALITPQMKAKPGSERYIPAFQRPRPLPLPTHADR